MLNCFENTVIFFSRFTTCIRMKIIIETSLFTSISLRQHNLWSQQKKEIGIQPILIKAQQHKISAALALKQKIWFQ